MNLVGKKHLNSILVIFTLGVGLFWEQATRKVLDISRQEFSEEFNIKNADKLDLN